MQMKSSRISIRTGSRLMIVGLLSIVLGMTALAQSNQFPTYPAGPLGPGSWVLGDGAIIPPAGTQVTLAANESTGTGVRAKAIALNPNKATSGAANGHSTAAVLTMGSKIAAVQVFDVTTGTILQTYAPFSLKSGSSTGIIYTSDGKYLLFSQDGPSYGGPSVPAGYVAIANVQAGGTLTDFARVNTPLAVDTNGYLTTVTCFPYNDLNGNVTGTSPNGTTGSSNIPCGQTVSAFGDATYTGYPQGIALSAGNSTAYVVLGNNNTLTKIDLTQNPPVLGQQVRVGNIPVSVAMSADGHTAYVSNEAGRVATASDFQGYSNGTPVVVNPVGSISTATISVVDLPSFSVKGTITLSGLHPTGLAWWGQYLLVADAYSDNISVIDSTTNKEVRKINLGLPIGTPSSQAAGGNPNTIAVDNANGIGYVALYNANAIAVVDLHANAWQPVKGMIPVGYGPSSVVLDAVDNVLLVANDKGIGTTNTPLAPPLPNATCSKSYGVCGFNSHQDQGTVSIIPVPGSAALAQMTQKVYQGNHWDLQVNIQGAFGGSKKTKPVAIPARIGNPSLIKHVFVIIRENRTYDQILGDVAGGNGDPALAVFGNTPPGGGPAVTPNAHQLVTRFPLLDNFYNPSRQSADGHNWIVQAMAPYSDDIQSPDWLRDYPSNGGQSIAYQTKGFLWDAFNKAGVSWKNYGEYIEYNRFNTSTCTSDPNNSASCEPSWCEFYADTLQYEAGKGPLQYQNTVSSFSPLPSLMQHTIQNYPQFDLGIPDQFRVDIWQQDFANDVKNGTVPQFEMMWISSDHTGGPPTAQAMQADNDLALGRYVDIISHSPIWSSSVIFVEEDDAQNGVDHVDGHRSPGYVISPYTVQGGSADHTFYTQVNMDRTIEQILGVAPMNQRDLVASPMRTLFTDNPPQANFAPWDHVLNAIPLSTGTSCSNLGSLKIDNPVVASLRDGWLEKKAELFAGNYHKPDCEDPDTVRHYNWYEATGFKVPYPGDKVVRPASEFNRPAPTAKADKDDDD